MIKDIAFTVYAVTDISKARDFYEGILGLKTGAKSGSKADENPSWVEYLVNGSAFAIGSSPDWKPSRDGATVAFEVGDFDGFIKKLKEKGVNFKMEPVGFANCSMAVIEDPDSNKIVIHRLHGVLSDASKNAKVKKTKKLKVKKGKVSAKIKKIKAKKSNKK